MDISISSSNRVEFLDITPHVQQACRNWGKSGLVHLFCPHTTAGVLVNEGFDPDVTQDILGWLQARIPEKAGYAHQEGNADAHIRSGLVGCQVSIPVHVGKLLLGRWQSLFFCEFDGPRHRRIRLTFVPGEGG